MKTFQSKIDIAANAKKVWCLHKPLNKKNIYHEKVSI